MSILVISGTGTEVGKTVVTAAVATLAAMRGSRVAVVKPAQTGAGPGEPGDLDTVRGLSGVTDLHEYARFPDPLSPAAAARHSGRAPLDLAVAADRIRDLALTRRLVLVEGAGGLLVRYDEEGATIADLAHDLGAPVLVVVPPALGTLNHTALTLEAMAGHGIDLAGVVLGSWPARPGLAERCNIRDLETLAARPLAGAFPEGAGRLHPAEFLTGAHAWLTPAFGGGFDAAHFRREYDPMPEPPRRTQP